MQQRSRVIKVEVQGDKQHIRLPNVKSTYSACNLALYLSFSAMTNQYAATNQWPERAWLKLRMKCNLRLA